MHSIHPLNNCAFLYAMPKGFSQKFDLHILFCSVYSDYIDSIVHLTPNSNDIWPTNNRTNKPRFKSHPEYSIFCSINTRNLDKLLHTILIDCC